MDDDDDAWTIPTTTMRDATAVNQDSDQDDDDDFFEDAGQAHALSSAVSDVGGGDRWIKVFGFTNLDVVLQEFEQVGKIERYEPAAGSGNWVLIKFARDYIQQFALEKDRQVIGSGSEQCMIGVVPWSKEQAEEESSQQVTRMWRPHGLNRLHPVTRQTPQKGPNKRRPRRPASTLCEKIMRCIFG